MVPTAHGFGGQRGCHKIGKPLQSSLSLGPLLRVSGSRRPCFASGHPWAPGAKNCLGALAASLEDVSQGPGPPLEETLVCQGHYKGLYIALT